MSNLELPPLVFDSPARIEWSGTPVELASLESVEARERILQARIAELEAEVKELREAAEDAKWDARERDERRDM